MSELENGSSTTQSSSIAMSSISSSSSDLVASDFDSLSQLMDRALDGTSGPKLPPKGDKTRTFSGDDTSSRQMGIGSKPVFHSSHKSLLFSHYSEGEQLSSRPKYWLSPNRDSESSLTTSDEDDISSLHDDILFHRRRKRCGTWPRTRSLNAPSPFQQFGPCGRIMKNSAMVIQIQDPAFQRLTWYKTPLTVLVIKKIRDNEVLEPFFKLTNWLIMEKNMVVYVEKGTLEDPNLVHFKGFDVLKNKMMVFQENRDNLTDKIDFIICLGGDGTLLYASSLFQQSVPPVMAFHLGSLGFLTPHVFDNFEEKVTKVLEGTAGLTLRSRLKCVLKVNKEKESHNSSLFITPTYDKETKDMLSPSNMTFLVLNEVVVDRGPSPYLSNVDLYIDGKHITVVQGDGLIVSTPTGSTAYAVAAGASMINPAVPAIMITPICPHSLSFRPIVVPAGVEINLKISADSRNTAWISFDGRSRQELKHGDVLSVTTSIYPVPSICAEDQIADWFGSLAECLQWNVRKRQKTLDFFDDHTNGSIDSESGVEVMDQ